MVKVQFRTTDKQEWRTIHNYDNKSQDLGEREFTQEDAETFIRSSSQRYNQIQWRITDVDGNPQ